MPIARLGKVEINYHTIGEGNAILFISGFGVDHRVWLPQITFFKDMYKVVVLDNRGIGKSKAPRELFTIKDMAMDCAALLNYLDIEMAYVVGSSMGGMIAQELAIKYPEKVKKLALCSTAAKIDRKMGKDLLKGLRKVMKEGVEDILSVNVPLFDRLFNYVMQMVFSKDFLRKNRSFIEYLVAEYTSKRDYPEMLIKQIRAIMKHDTTKRLDKTRSETLIITGECDNVIPPYHSDILHTLIPNSKLVKIPCGTHGVHLEQADIFNREILNFLEE